MKRAAVPLAAVVLLAGSTASSTWAQSAGGGLLDGLKSAVDQIASGVRTGVNADITGENIVIGTLAVRSPLRGLLTCFKDVPGGALSELPIRSITQARGFPALVVTQDGRLLSGNCAELVKLGVLNNAGSAAGAGGVAGAAAFNDRNDCSAVPVELRPRYAQRCVSFDADDPCSALPANGGFRNGQTALAGACDARRDRAVIDRVNAYKPKPK